MEEERKGRRWRRLRGKRSTSQTVGRVLGSNLKPIPNPLTQPREDLLEPKSGRTETVPQHPTFLKVFPPIAYLFPKSPHEKHKISRSLR